jgi:hypothetical protein
MVATIDKVLHGGYALFLNISGLVIAAIFVEPLLGRKIILFCIFYLDFVEALQVFGGIQIQ